MCCCNIALFGVNTSKDIDYQIAKLLFRTELVQEVKNHSTKGIYQEF